MKKTLEAHITATTKRLEERANAGAIRGTAVDRGVLSSLHPRKRRWMSSHLRRARHRRSPRAARMP